MARVEIKTRPWKRVEYERLIETGFFQPGDPIELIGGRLIVAEPQGSGHFAAIRAVEEALRAAFGAGWEVRGQGPVALDEESEPEPDVAVVPGSFRDYMAAHPSRPVLVVEVSESRLAPDRHHKGSLYARAGLDDYWIVNLAERPDWQLFGDGCPEGETADQVGARADRVVSRVRAAQGDVLLFSSAHVLRVLAARWLGLEPGAGRYFLLSTASLSALGYEHNRSQPVIRLWDDAGHAGM